MGTELAVRVAQVRVPDMPVRCPAGVRVTTMGGPSCVCRIEGSVIEAASSPSSLLSYCMSERGYQTCPTWRADKQLAWENRRMGRTPTFLDIARRENAEADRAREEMEAWQTAT